MSLVVLIDSGVDIKTVDPSRIIGGITIKKIDNEINVIDNSYTDVLGHGTAIFNILNQNCQNAEFFIIKIFDFSFDCDSKLFFYALEYVHKNLECQFIIASSGAILFNNQLYLKDLINALYLSGTLIISAFNNQGAISYPAAFDSVIGVDTNSSITSEQKHIVVRGSPIDVLMRERSY